jgi:hypothetical protein
MFWTNIVPLSSWFELCSEYGDSKLIRKVASDTKFQYPLITQRNRDIAVHIATGYRLDGQGRGVRVPIREGFSSLHIVQTCSGAHPASYPMDTGASFSGDKAAGA